MFTELSLGTCYYPEHWPETMWKEDLTRMLEVGIKTIRIAEFAWNKVEPEEGVYTYEFFDRFLDLCEEVGMKVIFCTPTATPPAWLTEKYPEVLNADRAGILYRHGGRRHYNYNSPVYREFSRKITEAFASHYAKRPCIIGWQLDNEFNCETPEFYSEADTAAFRVFLQKKYGTLDALNEAWGTVFWNQTYTDWNQIYVPRHTIGDTQNPHELLDYKRFVSDSTCTFAKEQSDIIRKYLKPGDYVTTNGIFGNLDNIRLREESLDVLMYDSYPNFAFCLDQYKDDPKDLKDRKWSRNLTDVRAFNPIFGIMEQQSGANGWYNRMAAPTPRPGQLTLWTMQSIAHGADFVSYFRWRTCTFGTEMYWHGILDYSSRDNRRLREVGEVNEKLQKMQGITGKPYQAKVAMLKDYDNNWDSEVDYWHGSLDQASQKAIFAAAERSHTPLDFVYLDHADLAQLCKYELLIYPHACLMNEERAALLKAYAEQGGKIVFGARSGYKKMNGQCTMEKLPGLLKKLTGADVLEYSLIAPDAGKVTVDYQGDELEAAVFTEIIEAMPGAELIGSYTSDYYAGTGAMTHKKVGMGDVYYYGTAWTEAAAAMMLTKLNAANPCKELMELPEGVELAVRGNEDEQYYFLLNYSKEPVVLRLKKEFEDLWTGKCLNGAVSLEGYGVLVLK